MNQLTAFFICGALLIIFCFTVRYENDAKFNIWYLDLIKHAPFYGYTSYEIEEWCQDEWIEYFANGLSPEEALKQYLKDN